MFRAGIWMCVEPFTLEFELLMLMPSSPVSMVESRKTTSVLESGSKPGVWCARKQAEGQAEGRADGVSGGLEV
jgi:hypothetical protein